MKKIALATLLSLGLLPACFAQTEVSTEKKEKSTDQFIGIQVNDLVRQVLNFNGGNANGNNSNPYLLTYSLNSRKTGVGLRVGVGYTYNSFSTSDGITATTTNLNDLHVRIGVEKAWKLSNRWSTGVGFDLVYNNNDDHTTNATNIGGVINPGITPFGSGSTDVSTNIVSLGGGPAAWIRFHLTNRISIGTEASFYFLTGDQTDQVSVDGVPTNPSTSNSVTRATFNSPVALFLNIKF